MLNLLSAAHAACTVVDDTGEAVRLAKPAQRIISLAPDLTETLFTIGVGEHLVGVMQGSDYPPAVNKIARVGSYSGLDLEKIMTLHPDLVVTWSTTFARQLAVLKKFGIPVYVSEPHQLEDVQRTMNQLGCLVGTTSLAHAKSRAYLQRLATLRKQYQTRKTLTVFYQIGAYSLITINKNSWISEVITLCGGKNVFAQAMSIAPEVSWESVVSANPEVIITDTDNKDWKKRWAAWPQLKAVQHGFLFSISADLIDRPGPRILDGAAQLCGYLNLARIS